jgi:hypothetical protein
MQSTSISTTPQPLCRSVADRPYIGFRKSKGSIAAGDGFITNPERLWNIPAHSLRLICRVILQNQFQQNWRDLEHRRDGGREADRKRQRQQKAQQKKRQ